MCGKANCAAGGMDYCCYPETTCLEQWVTYDGIRNDISCEQSGTFRHNTDKRSIDFMAMKNDRIMYE